MSMTPRIGITMSYEDGTLSLDRRYVTAVEAAGGLPVPLPMLEEETAIQDYITRLDGLVVPGGPAVTEGLKGTLPDGLDRLDPVRDRTDRSWIESSWRTGRPILGICYGMQRLNALAGGTIYADVEHQLDGALAHSQKRGGTTHPVQFHPDSQLGSLLNTSRVSVNTRHFQAIADVGDGFSVSATAPDGVIEAIEHESGKIFGVQFHPERMENELHALFRLLVRKASEHMTTS